MSGAAHTPGPWIARKDPNAINPDDWCVGTGPQNIDKVAVCSFRDAHLIAAAPDLLDALKELRDWYQEHIGLPACAANAAISKATGVKP